MILVGCVPGDFHGTCIRGKCARENWSILDKNDRDAKIRLFILYVTITIYAQIREFVAYSWMVSPQTTK